MKFQTPVRRPAAVDGIGPAGVKGLDVEMFFAPLPTSSSGGEGHADIAMRNIFRPESPARVIISAYHGFVVRPEQRFSVGGDQRVCHKADAENRTSAGEHLIADTQRDIAAAIVFNNLRINVFTTGNWEVSTWEIKPMAGISPQR